MKKEKEWGGIRPGAGRKPIAEATMQVVLHVRMSQEQRHKVELLGGGRWVRAAIDDAPTPGDIPKN